MFWLDVDLTRNKGQDNGSRMNMALIMSAVKRGVTVANYCEVKTTETAN